MKRRHLLLALGGTSVSATALVGTGAFTSVEAERAVTVETARDTNAFLRLVSEEKSDRSSSHDGQIAFRIPGRLERLDTPDTTNSNDPEGVGRQSVYRFAKEAAGAEPPLFRAENRGTQSVQIYGSPEETDNSPAVSIFETETREVLTEQNPSDELEPGSSVGLGLEVATHGLDTDELYGTVVTIHAVTASELSS